MAKKKIEKEVEREVVEVPKPSNLHYVVEALVLVLIVIGLVAVGIYSQMSFWFYVGLAIIVFVYLFIRLLVIVIMSWSHITRGTPAAFTRTYKNVPPPPEEKPQMPTTGVTLNFGPQVTAARPRSPIASLISALITLIVLGVIVYIFWNPLVQLYNELTNMRF